MELNLDGQQKTDFVKIPIGASPEVRDIIPVPGKSSHMGGENPEGWPEHMSECAPYVENPDEWDKHMSKCVPAVKGEHPNERNNRMREWHTRMSECELAVCRVEILIDNELTAVGTGFLVKPDIAFTSYHVIKRVVKGRTLKDNVVLRFDYKTTADTGQVYRLTAGDRLIDKSSVDELDYALLKVDGNPGSQLIDSPMGKRKRGWLTPQKYKFKKKKEGERERVAIIQHPESQPLKRASGFVEGIAGDLVYYTANTCENSSGSPVFTCNWDLVALHGKTDSGLNVGIKFRAILKQPKVKKALGI